MTLESIQEAIASLSEYKSPSLIECNQFTADLIKNKCLELYNIKVEGNIVSIFGLNIVIKNYFPDYIYQIK